MILSNQNYSRIDTSELTFMIFQKIGHQRAEKYLDLISRLFNLKISKCKFNKFCIRTIGRENVHLHNRLIRSLIMNACVAKVPPLMGSKKGGTALNAGYHKSCLQSLCRDAFPRFPRKVRSAVNRDRPSSLRPDGKPQNTAYHELIIEGLEKQSPTVLLSLDSRPTMDVISVEDGEEVEQVAGSPCIQSRCPVTAPLGVSIHSGGARKALPNLSVCGTFHHKTFQSCGELSDTRSLRTRLEQKLEKEGISVSVDCVNLLNNGLDAYLKRLLEPCMQLARARHGDEHFKELDGMYLGGSNEALPGRHFPTEEKPTYASMQDFGAAVELNPQILGGDWAIQLEKILSRASV